MYMLCVFGNFDFHVSKSLYYYIYTNITQNILFSKELGNLIIQNSQMRFFKTYVHGKKCRDYIMYVRRFFFYQLSE